MMWQKSFSYEQHTYFPVMILRVFVFQEVENQLWTTLYDYPSLKACKELLKYINQACRTAYV